jgi:plasmid stability protein
MGNVQIRNVPADLHRTLRLRAAEADLTLSDYLLRLVQRDAERPTRAEMLARLEALPRPELHDEPADAVRAMRDEM